MSEHYYTRTGEPMHWVPNKSKGGTRATTIKDARALDLLPSVTGILKVINKPALITWMIKQAVHAVVTAPDIAGEDIDAKLVRVLEVERQDKEEAAMAADKGTAVHEAVELCLNGKDFDPQWRPYVEAALPIIGITGKVAWTERVLVGEGYAGKSDIGTETERHVTILDIKTTGRVPKEAYPEHRMQVSAYCKALGNVADRHVVGGLLYLSTSNPGETNLCLMDNWEKDYEAFRHAFELWKHLNNYQVS